MEKGQPVTINARKIIVFPDKKNNLRFVQPGTSITIMRPGGKLAKDGYSKYMQNWYTKNVNNSINKSMFFEKTVSEIVKELNKSKTGKMSALSTIKKVSDRYSRGVSNL
ncbi:hypothetical protein EBU94_06700 [bacterium]|nr:hypothetical protein [bacterium]